MKSNCDIYKQKKTMNAYFFKMNQAEKNDILNQHRYVYDGFVTTYGQQINQQPLYVQDYANDKGGITVNNKGVVKTYTNININESDGFTGAKYLPDAMDFGGVEHDFEPVEYVSFNGKDMIADDPSHMIHGTFQDEDDDYYELVLDIQDEPKFEEIDDIEQIGDEIDFEEFEPLQEQINKTLDMFKRFKKY